MNKITFFLLASLSVMFTKAQTVDLKLNLEKGKEYKQVFNSKATVIQEFNEQKVEIVMVINGTMTYNVNFIDERGFDIEAKYEKLSMAMHLPQGTMEFNSDIDNANDIMSTFLSKMTNKPFGFVMSRTGKVLEVKNMDALWESVLSEFNQLTDTQKAQLMSQVKNAYGDKAFKGNLEMTSAIFPENPVNKGDKWTVNTNLETTLAADMTTEYIFEDLTEDYALIKGNSRITSVNKDEYTESNGMHVKYELSGSMISEIKIDISSGWVIESKISQEIKGIVHIKENGMTVPMTMINEMTITNN